MNNSGQHHVSIRRRVYKKQEQYPSTDKVKRRADELAYVFGIAGPLLTLPQLYTIFVDKNVAGISIISWAGFSLVSFFWIYYGILHKEKPIIISQCLWAIFQISIVVGALMYR